MDRYFYLCPEWKIWNQMHRRCTNPKATDHARYGGRGIRVCERWANYENFLADMGRRPSKAHTIDRIDNDGNYEAGNCRWATRAEQGRNQRSNRRVTFDGKTQTMSDWAREIGVSVSTLHARLTRHAIPIERALSMKKWARH